MCEQFTPEVTGHFHLWTLDFWTGSVTCHNPWTLGRNCTVFRTLWFQIPYLLYYRALVQRLWPKARLQQNSLAASAFFSQFISYISTFFIHQFYWSTCYSAYRRLSTFRNVGTVTIRNITVSSTDAANDGDTRAAQTCFRCITTSVKSFLSKQPSCLVCLKWAPFKHRQNRYLL